MSVVLAALAGGSTLANIVGGNAARKAQRRALRKQARAREKQAQKLLEQNRINLFNQGIEGQEFAAQQTVSFAKAGVDVGSGSALQALADTQAQVLANQYLSNEEAKFNAQQLRTEGQALRDSATNLKKQQTFENIGTLFRGASQIASTVGEGGK